MSKLLLVAALVLSALACDATNEPTVADDLSVDSLPPIKSDGGVDSKPGVGADSKPAALVTTCTVPASSDFFGKSLVSNFIPVSNDVKALCNSLVLALPSSGLYGLDCEHPELDWGGSFCLTVSGPDASGMYVANGMGIVKSPGYVSSTVACSTSGAFVGWLCAGQSI